MLKIYLILLSLFFCSSLGSREKNTSENKSVPSYSECGSIGVPRVEKIFGKLTSEYFTEKILMKKFLRDWITPLNIALTKFLSKDEMRIDDFEYYEEALSFMKFDTEKIAECFFNSFQENNSIYQFEQKSSQGSVKGYVIVEDGMIKTVYYSTLVLI